MHVERAKMAILAQEDTDRNEQVTVEDTGPKTIRLGTLQSGGIVRGEIHGTYMISSLLQELALHSDTEHTSASAGHLVISQTKLQQNPVDRLLEMIQNRFWPALVRRLDGDGLALALKDSKNRTEDKMARIYVPQKDLLAQDYYRQVKREKPELELDVIVLPSQISPTFVASIRDKPGILSLKLEQSDDERVEATPFVVPGGRFNEMYGWDSYFCALGLLEQPDPTGFYLYLARSMVDNLVYEIEHYGKILNANRSYYLTRSQPPLLTSMAKAVYRKIIEIAATIPPITGHFERATRDVEGWRGKVFRAAIKEYENVWMSEPRLVPQYGLSRYFDEGIGIPMETEEKHFEPILQSFSEKWGLGVHEFAKAFNSGAIKEPDLDAYFVHDRALRESGHDTTYRFDGKTVDLLTVDLNCLLYRYEMDISDYLESVNSDNSKWLCLAGKRRERMRALMWDESRGLWFDYDFVKGEKSDYESVTSFWAMWSGIASPEEAELMVERSLGLFEVGGGLVAGTEKSRGPISLLRPNRQWDYPCGWAPHQMMAWEGLKAYGYTDVAKRLAYRWLHMITRCFAEYNAVVPEKFDVVARSHKVTAEYGNVGTDFRMVPMEGFGWMNASYQVGMRMMGRAERRALELVVPPERLFRI